LFSQVPKYILIAVNNIIKAALRISEV